MTPIPKVGLVPSKKPESRAPMGAMVRTVLGLLCLLLAPAGASEEGEVCLGWLPLPVEGSLPFRCPQRPDGTDGRFCCGICIAPYCCDSEEARLHQGHCLYVWRTLQLFVGAIMARRGKASRPVSQHLQTSPASDPQARGVRRSGAGDTTPSPRAQLNMVQTGMVLAGVVCVLLMLPLLVVILCKCCLRTQGCPYLRRGDASTPEYPTAMCSSHPRPPGTPPPSYCPPDRPGPDEESPPPPPYSQVARPSRPRGQDGASAGPRSLAFAAVRGSEGAATQAPTTTSGPTGAPGAAGEVTPVQEAAGRGEAASPLASSAAPGVVVSSQPAPVERTISASFGVIRETDV